MNEAYEIVPPFDDELNARLNNWTPGPDPDGEEQKEPREETVGVLGEDEEEETNGNGD